MPAGRPPLDPDIREARRQESRRRYEAKNLAARRERAQVRMAKQVEAYTCPALLIRSRRRTEITQMTAKDRRRHHERIAEDSAQYRDRRREAELRAQEHQETLRHKKSEVYFINYRILNFELLPAVHRALATNAVRRAHGLPNIPVTQGRPHFPRQDLSSQGRAALPAAGSHSDDGPLSDETTSGWRRTRATTPPIYKGGITPRTCTVAPRNGLTMPTARDISSPPALSAGGEDCPGCSCICPESTQLKEHGGHFEGPYAGNLQFLSRIFLANVDGDEEKGLRVTICDDAPPYETGVLLCTPIYAPDPGHEDQDTHTGGYFVVVHDEWKGVVTSQESLACALKRYPGARTFTAYTWLRRLPHRNSGHLRHRGSLASTQAQRRQNEEHNTFLVAENTRIEAEDKGRIELQEGLAYLAATKPPLVPLSSQRARLQFERVLGLGAGASPLRSAPNPPIAVGDPLPPPAGDSPPPPADSSRLPAYLAASMDGNSHLKRTHCEDAAITGTSAPEYTDLDPGPSAPPAESLKRAPRLYAVSGHSLIVGPAVSARLRVSFRCCCSQAASAASL
ncbi:hypothetical protein B0H14DRAFT_2623295 [Mycena olivaceomarginata]|nr:hypothetical protein B0H14DRAFT_2623295 [Mycena olivaceomarginata]